MAKQKYSDPNGRHIRVYATLLNSPAYRTLGYAARALFVDLREKITSTNNGNIEATLSTLKHKGWNSPATLAKCLYELRALGFLVQTRGGGVEIGSRVCSLFRFTDLPAYDFPKLGITACKATHDYLQFETVGAAEVALRTGVQDLREKAIERKQKAADRKKTTLQNLKRTDTDPVAVEGGNRYKNCSREPSTASKIVADKTPTKQPKSRASKGFAQDLTEATQ